MDSRAFEADLRAGSREADVHVVLVARVGDDDRRRPVESGRVSDEDHLGAGGDEAVEEILRAAAIDLAGRKRRSSFLSSRGK